MNSDENVSVNFFKKPYSKNLILLQLEMATRKYVIFKNLITTVTFKSYYLISSYYLSLTYVLKNLYNEL